MVSLPPKALIVVGLFIVFAIIVAVVAVKSILEQRKASTMTLPDLEVEVQGLPELSTLEAEPTESAFHDVPANFNKNSEVGAFMKAARSSQNG